MVKCAREMRASALASLKGKWTDAVLVTLVMFLCICVLSVLTFIPVLGPIIVPFAEVVITMGFMCALLNMIRTGEPVETIQIFGLFKEVRLWLTLVLMTVYTFLWTLLFVIPGIIKSLAYYMTPFILKDNPDLQYNDAIDLSIKMMRGHKWDLFCLQLSFIGWGLLCILTLGIGFLWLIPYMYTSMASFYEDVKAEYAEKQAVGATAQ